MVGRRRGLVPVVAVAGTPAVPVAGVVSLVIGMSGPRTILIGVAVVGRRKGRACLCPAGVVVLATQLPHLQIRVAGVLSLGVLLVEMSTGGVVEGPVIVWMSRSELERRWLWRPWN